MKTSVTVSVKTKRTYGPKHTESIIKTVRSNSALASYNFSRRGAALARRKVHVITGTLRDSIKSEKVSYGVHRIVVGANYGVYEEYGTRYRPAHPYFRPAIAEAKVQFLTDLRYVFQQRVVNNR